MGITSVGAQTVAAVEGGSGLIRGAPGNIAANGGIVGTGVVLVGSTTWVGSVVMGITSVGAQMIAAVKVVSAESLAVLSQVPASSAMLEPGTLPQVGTEVHAALGAGSTALPELPSSGLGDDSAQI